MPRRKKEMYVEVFHRMGEPATGGDVPISDTPWNSGETASANISWLVLSPTHLPDAFPDETLDQLPIEVLADLQEQMIQQQNLLDRAGERMVALIERKYGERLKTAQSTADTGTFCIEEGNYEIKMEIKKKVEWDQDFLGKLRAKIYDAGDKPDDYISMKTTYSVSERAYQGWNDAIKNTFLPGRTLKPSKPTYSIEVKF
jgi:hypothetical protein